MQSHRKLPSWKGKSLSKITENGSLWSWDNSFSSWLASSLCGVFSGQHQVRSSPERRWVCRAPPGGPGRGRGLGLCEEVVWTREEGGGLRRAWPHGTFPKGGDGTEDGQVWWPAEHRVLVVKGGEDAQGRVQWGLEEGEELDRMECFCGARWEEGGEVRSGGAPTESSGNHQREAAFTPLEEWP